MRQFTLEDYPQVVELWRAAGLNVGQSESLGGLERKLQRDPELFLVAEVDEQVAGAVVGAFDGRRGYFYRLAVHPARQGNGIGTALVKEVEKRLFRLGCRKVNAMVLEDNQRALALYQHLGYTPAPVTVVMKELS